MKSAIARLSTATLGLLTEKLRTATDWQAANQRLRVMCGIECFFANESEFARCLTLLEPKLAVADEMGRREYGDFQTPLTLSDAVCSHLVRQRVPANILLEPTFGLGTFMVSALTHFPALKEIHGVEIHEPYCWRTKFAILELFVRTPALKKPRILLHHADVFRFDFRALARGLSRTEPVLVLGNPPWVTNAELGSLNSRNLPRKSNIKALTGLDAITGKGNFDIGEYIILTMLDAFSEHPGGLAMLAKNSVVRNLIHDLPRGARRIGDVRALRIDAQKFFGASVDASLITCRFQKNSGAYTCRIAAFDNPTEVEREFGWIADRFVSDVGKYGANRKYDGSSPYVWRQGVKHDCSRIMELRRTNGSYMNGLGEELELEPAPIFGLVKSSDLRAPVVSKPSRSVIITQRKVGESTAHLALEYPKLHAYLIRNAELLRSRKSTIYRDNPPFSIFGIGDYSFRPYKVAISGLYKRSTFSLVLPDHGRPVMLDDTCYFLGFDHAAEAAIVWALLNSELAQQLLHSLVFLDAKRPYTKDVLMRIALDQVAQDVTFPALLRWIEETDGSRLLKITEHDWRSFLEALGRRGTPDEPDSLFGPASMQPVQREAPRR